MKRIDRIFSALSVPNFNNNKDVIEKVYTNCISASDVKLNPPPEMLTVLSLVHMNQKVDTEITMAAGVEINYLPSEMVTVCNNIELSVVNIEMAQAKTLNVEQAQHSNFQSPVAPTYSPLTPLVQMGNAKAKTLPDVERQSDFDSPMGPTYSPLTPLVVNQKATSTTDCNERKSSPLLSMSPLTLELYQTLNEVDPLYEELQPQNFVEPLQQKTHGKEQREPASYINSDSDSDFVPNTDSESSNKDIPVRWKNDVSSVRNSKKKKVNPAPIADTTAKNVDNLTVETCVDDVTSRNSDQSESLLQIQENFEIENSGQRPKRGRKRKHPDYTLRDKKLRKYSNLPYQGKTKFVDTKVFRDFSCSCKNKCHQLISREKREHEFHKYMSLGSYEAQLMYIVNSVKESPKTRSYTVVNGNKTGKKQPKEFKRRYSIANIEVCRVMFINTFQITPKKVDTSLKKFRNGICINDQRGQAVGGWNKTQEEDVQFVKNVINLLPKYESHYRREQNSGFQYLKLGMTVQKIYELYLEKLKQVYGDAKRPVSFSTLRHIFCTNFNLRCKSLKKDTCSKCDAFNNKIKNTSNEDQEKIKEERIEHLKRAKDLRNSMKEDLLRSKRDERFECITFDLEKTLPLPRIPTSVVFYKRQLWLYNCGIHVGSDDSAYCYVWIEGEAGRGAQEVGSCLIKYIKNKLNPKIEHLVLWSDCCGGQNRNIKIIVMLKVILNHHHTLKSITLNYLESGHTFLPNDTDFSKIETQLKYHERIYTAEEYISVIKQSKKKNPIQVERMKKEDFLSTKKLEKNIVNRKIFISKAKVNWLQTKQILMKKEDVYAIFMRIQNSDQYETLNIAKKIRGKSLELSENDFCLLWPNGKEIPQAKLDDINSLFEFIPRDCLDFYKSLRGSTGLHDDIDGFEGEPDFNTETETQEEETL